MKKLPIIVVVFTEHLESGVCNADELCRIMETIRPEIIFEEDPDDEQYKAQYEGDCKSRTLEKQAIVRYKSIYDVEHVPIDKPIDEEASIYAQHRLGLEYKGNGVHASLVKKHCFHRNERGFEYLNSEQCSDVVQQLQAVEEFILSTATMYNPSLMGDYDLFQSEVHARESHMLNRIDEYCERGDFKIGLFLIGFRHRHTLWEKIMMRKIDGTQQAFFQTYSEYLLKR